MLRTSQAKTHRFLFALVALALLGQACAGNGSSSGAPPSEENATAVYIELSTDRYEADEMFTAIFIATGDEPADVAGSLRGLALGAIAADSRGLYGLRIVFGDDAVVADRVLVKEKAGRAGAGKLTWLGAGDLWPYCVGESDCLTVSGSISGG